MYFWSSNVILKLFYFELINCTCVSDSGICCSQVKYCHMSQLCILLFFLPFAYIYPPDNFTYNRLLIIQTWGAQNIVRIVLFELSEVQIIWCKPKYDSVQLIRKSKDSQSSIASALSRLFIFFPLFFFFLLVLWMLWQVQAGNKLYFKLLWKSLSKNFQL